MCILRPEETILLSQCDLSNTLGIRLHPVIRAPDLLGCFQTMLTLLLHCNLHATGKIELHIYKSLPCSINQFIFLLIHSHFFLTYLKF